MDQDKPNLFAFATSELSQDAFLAWLLSWADPKYAAFDPPVHQCAARLVQRAGNTHRIKAAWLSR
ncbi:hypothetical protein G3480_26250 [Thiorhodococcus mannitoliphagus]|uniref:Uncharacterized protein n=1 Tax=Thiorhodococcus mannitoliphagus TaxID=329406 RepID=A0A6P1DZJ0_9GAMM|nr:hypothetical protein [Thiorhodococcus mannitoliphagus]NEX23727.1 hypothetical protein [Thiorhodococcus mannitoliphagus]